MDSVPQLQTKQALPAMGPGPDAVANLRRRAVRGGTLLIATRALTQVFVWASTLLIARFLTPLDYGLMSIGLLLVGLADLFAEAGIGRALIQKARLEPRDVDEGFTLNFVLALAMYGLLFCLVVLLHTFSLVQVGIGLFHQFLILLLGGSIRGFVLAVVHIVLLRTIVEL